MKRSAHIALVVMSAATVGGFAYSMMPRETCAPQNGAATGAGQRPCGSSRWSGGHYGGGFSLFGSSDSSGSNSTAAGPGRAMAGAERGGFGGTSAGMARGG
jgi:hypothetical protein